MLIKLKAATEELHREIEKENLAGLIISNEISLEEYKLLLLQNYSAYAIAEPMIAKYLDTYQVHKSPLLLQDLEQLGVNCTIPIRLREMFRIVNKAEAFGAAYVVEGSALGGLLISKQIDNCPALTGIGNHYFFNGKRENIKSWNAFSKFLKMQEFTPLEEIQAIDKAKDTFVFFREVFRTTSLVS